MTSVSVVMPSLNSGRHIGEAIQSVLDQEQSELELVIQDGGSSDETQDVVRSFEDSRISWTSEPDGGQSDALNKAIRRSLGEWILWLNADYRLATGAFGRIVTQLLPEHPVWFTEIWNDRRRGADREAICMHTDDVQATPGTEHLSSRPPSSSGAALPIRGRPVR